MRLEMIRYSKLGYVGINVTDIERARRFYEHIVGLQFVEAALDGSLRFRCSADYYNVVLHQSAQPGFRYIGLMLQDDNQYEELRRRLEARDIAYEIMSGKECGERRLQSGWRISEPHLKAAFEFYRPLSEDAGARFAPSVVKIQRIGHVVLATPQYKEALAFLRNVLNLAESDDIDGVIAFFRLFPNPYHHGIGVGAAPRNILHHVNFMVSEIDDIGMALNRFKRSDVPVVFGPGRHIASNSVFLYYLDPDGLTLEYSFGMEEFPEVNPRPPRTLPPRPESIDSWGGVRDPRMSTVGIVHPFEVDGGWAPLGRPAR
jgi:2,3-dihydroxy-p-cumate/2,3-dihydroxybenzoate 3,4-dioxygenase